MSNNEYLAYELAYICIRYMPESREHRVLEAVIDILLGHTEEEEKARP